MLPMTMSRFESLSLLAGRENWCWKMYCSTCGHGHFRWSFKALACGLDPAAPNWPVHREMKGRELERRNGPLPQLGSWPVAEQKALQGSFDGFHCAHVIENVGFPDWLGHLGLFLLYTQEVEATNLIISNQLVSQLTDRLLSESDGTKVLNRVSRESRALSWRDLETIEASWRRG